MTLRSEAIEAMAKAIDPFMVHPLETTDAATSAFDALLDYLTANIEEWDEAARSLRRVPTSSPGPSLFLSVLRVEEGDNK